MAGPGPVLSASAGPAAGSGRPPLWFWIPVALVPTLVWLFVLPFQSATGPPFLDWNIYRAGFDLWRAVGTPYVVLPPGWDPYHTYPYLYPPTSWPLMVAAAALPPAVAAVGALPLLLAAPRLRLVPVCALLLVAGLGPALYLANANLLVAGLIVLSFLPGRRGGVAFAALVAIKLYPIVLLPLLFRDRRRVEAFAVVLGILLVTGTAFFGLRGWSDMVTTLLNEGPHPDITWNPFLALGTLRLVPAGLVVLVGLGLRSPTITLIGATWTGSVITNHYLVTVAAALAVEPPVAATLGRARRSVAGFRGRIDAARSVPHAPPAGSPAP